MNILQIKYSIYTPYFFFGYFPDFLWKIKCGTIYKTNFINYVRIVQINRKMYLIHSSAFFFRLIDEKCTVSIYTHCMINIRLYLYCFYNLYNIATHRSHMQHHWLASLCGATVVIYFMTVNSYISNVSYIKIY